MTVIVRLAKSEDQSRCLELLDVLAKATSDPHEIFDSETFKNLISNERGSLVVAEENKKARKELLNHDTMVKDQDACSHNH